MYTDASKNFNESIEQIGGRTFKVRFENSRYADYSDDILKASHHIGSNGGDSINIGTAVSSYIEMRVSKQNGAVLFRDFYDFNIGVLLEDGTFEFIPCGKYKPTNIQDNDSEIVITANDKMYFADIPYESNLKYPIGTIAVLNEICEKLEILPPTDISDIIIQKPNKQEDDKAFNGYTMREVIGYIAGLYGKFAIINRFGNLEFKWYEESNITFDINKCYSYDKNSEDYEIQKISIHVDSETTYEEGSGTQGLSNSNPFATQEIVSDIYSKISNFTYRGGKAKVLGDCRIDAWDIVTVKDIFGNIYKMPVMSMVTDIDGGITSTIESYSEKTNEKFENSFEGPMTKTLERTQASLFIVNRLVAEKASISYLEANYITANEIDTLYLKTANLDTEVANVGYLKANDADIKYATIVNLDAETARINNLEATTLTADQIAATYLKTINFSAELAKVNTLTANDAFIQNIFSSNVLSETLDAIYMSTDFANIDIANVNKANIGTMLAEIGLITSAVISEGHVTGYLDSVEVNANNITAGTLTVDRLIISGNDKSILYAINNAGELTSKSVNTLDGDVLTKRTIAADHLIANTITSNEITTENLVGSNGWYNVHDGTMFLGNANTGKQLSWDGDKLYINSDVIINITDSKYTDMFDGLQKQIDGATDIFFQSDVSGAPDVPTLDNYPANQWKPNEYANHKNAMYYADDGTVYRFQLEDVMYGAEEVYSGADKVQTYYWKIIDDNMITKAVALANEAKQSALTVTTDLGIYKDDMNVRLKSYVTTETHAHDLEITQNLLKSYVADNYTTTVDLVGENGILSEYTKTKQLASEIRQTSTEIGLAVSEVSEEKVDSIKIGAENLLLDSEDLGKSIIYTDVVYDGNNIVYYGTDKVVA